MPADDLEPLALAHYVEELRRGSTDPYVAYRVYEDFFQLEDIDNDLLKGAIRRLIETDPWFLATPLPMGLDRFSVDELHRIEASVGSGPASGYAALLRAKLWYHAGWNAASHLQRALDWLQQVPTEQREGSWLEMLVGCYEVLDFEQYKQTAPKLIARARPEYRASPLMSFLRTLAHEQDWVTYDQFRPEWDQLPANRSTCECYTNHLHTADGLRAAANEQWDLIPDLLVKAAGVRGCAHLNSYGMRIDLAALLIAEKRHVAQVRAYLERARAFGGDKTKLAELQRQLDAIATFSSQSA